jgi:carbamoyl-phosphate synthase large subunit
MKHILITCIGCAPASAICRSLSEYYTVGIDIQEECIGTFICNKYISLKDDFNTETYWNKINQIIIEEKIHGIFVTGSHETYEWSKRNFNCEVYLNNTKFIEITNNKLNTYDFCIKNNINVPELKKITDRPIVIKQIEGCGSKGLKILKTHLENEFVNDLDGITMIQEYIYGDEYTVDVISNQNGDIINIIPKKRLLIKNGQSFKSVIEMNKEIIEFVKDVCYKFKNTSSINVQVIKNEKNIYLIEINPRFATTINLSIEGGVHIPKMLIEHDYNKYDVKDGLMMIRDYKEYFKNIYV